MLIQITYSFYSGFNCLQFTVIGHRFYRGLVADVLVTLMYQCYQMS